jgi:hypothetical protein
MTAPRFPASFGRWPLAILPATGGALLLWLFLARLAHPAAPSFSWWLGLAVALALGALGCTASTRAGGGRLWGGLVAPALAGAALAFDAPRSVALTLGVLACVGGAAAVLDWAGEGPQSRPAHALDALAAGATLLAGLVPAAAAPVIGAIALALLAAALGRRLPRGSRRRPTVLLLVAIGPALLLAHGIAWPGASMAVLAGPLCVAGLLVDANRRVPRAGGGADPV